MYRHFAFAATALMAAIALAPSAWSEPNPKKYCGPEYPIHPPANGKSYNLDHCYVVGTWSNMLKATKVVKVPAGESVSSLELIDLSAIKGGEKLQKQLAAYTDKHPVTSLLIMKEGKIFYEEYQYGRTAKDRMLGQSMTKTVIGLAGLAALSNGAVPSLDATVNDLTPNYKATSFGSAKLRNLMTMSSGVDFPVGPDLWKTSLGDAIDAAYYFGYAEGGPSLFARIKGMRAKPGTEFAYSNGDVMVFADAITSAVGKPLESYFSETVWTKIGAESEAYFLSDTAGRVCAYGGFNATARDWGRLGLLIANNGNTNGVQVISPDLMKAAVTGSKANPGYGYFTWLDKKRGAFMLKGFGGQFVIGSQKSKVVLVQTAVYLGREDYNEKKLLDLWNSAQKLLAEY